MLTPCVVQVIAKQRKVNDTLNLQAIFRYCLGCELITACACSVDWGKSFRLSKPLNAIVGVFLSSGAHAVCRTGDCETAQGGDILDLQAIFSQSLRIRGQ